MGIIRISRILCDYGSRAGFEKVREEREKIYSPQLDIERERERNV